MKNVLFARRAKFVVQVFMALAILFTFVPGSVGSAYASPSSAPDSCRQLLADAEARFRSTLAPDGSVPATPETRAAALEYIRVSKLCYEEIEKQNSATTLQAETPNFIDDGGVILGGASSAEFVLNGRKWGSSSQGTAGGTVTYSFMGNGLSFSAENYGNSTAITFLPGFQPCFITEIQNAFSVWQAVSNIKFVQVTDSGLAFNASNAGGDIRIGAHYFDGPSGTLAHSYYPPPNGISAAGDVHFDSSENWSCNTSGIDIGIVAMHEIGHSLGLAHEDTSAVALMDPYYNASLTGLQSDDIHGATSIYGAVANLTNPTNDNFASPTIVGGIPFTDSLSVTDATVEAGEPTVNASCDGRMLKVGTNTVWYKFTPGTSGLLSMDTLGSNYDTYIAAWTGSTINSLTLAGCDDDGQIDLTSQLSINLTAGTPYYIQVAKYNGTQGSGTNETACNTPTYPTCNLVFNITVPKQTFADVPPTHPYYEYIEALYAAGFTAGCTTAPLNYCPSTNLDRGAAAVFVVRGNFGSGYIPAPATHIFFKEDWKKGTWAEPWAEGMYKNGLSAGCSSVPLKYCPWDLIPREQWVIFGLRLKYGVNYLPPAATGTLFADMTDPSYFATSWAEKAYTDGLIQACGNSGGKPKFCPKVIVDRGLAAYVVAKAKGLVP
jgi:hypothetical protein